MVRRTAKNMSRALLMGALPIAIALNVTGVAQAAPEPAAVVQTVDAPAAAPVAGVPLEIATNPDAQDHDPVHNGIAAGALAGATGSAIVGAVTGLGILSIPGAIAGALNGALWGTVIGALVGVFAPQAVPQVLP
ncbi:hypothetical protein [Nocardia pseudobrasiliensis]|uniref:Outer membrane protein with glycine zipper n=1 Tax=Nocardia pseudobrasiliensis TaxID=45979 RepID=A0A370HZQ5_9NOCA|nr:hypothetical protein [Nocardia pseudobrasiliensis]RDI63986.1 hypothetical protein DFR76_109326 [Nocardia pseudobrasiliensis]